MATRSTKKAVREKKTVKPAAKSAATVSSTKVWTTPIAMLIFCVAAGGLLLAARESSNAVHAAAAPTMAAVPVTHNAPVESAPKTVDAAAATAAPTPRPPLKSVSISGCLQRGGDGFVLKDTEGSAAPRTRSWKSGFLKRGSAAVALTDASNAMHLASHLGQRVSVTGPLVDRDLRVLSLRRVAASCE